MRSESLLFKINHVLPALSLNLEPKPLIGCQNFRSRQCQSTLCTSGIAAMNFTVNVAAKQTANMHSRHSGMCVQVFRLCVWDYVDLCTIVIHCGQPGSYWEYVVIIESLLKPPTKSKMLINSCVVAVVISKYGFIIAGIINWLMHSSYCA